MYCLHCGTQLVPGARFCGNCSTPLNAVAPSSPAESKAPPENPFAQTVPVAVSGSKPVVHPTAPADMTMEFDGTLYSSAPSVSPPVYTPAPRADIGNGIITAGSMMAALVILVQIIIFCADWSEGLEYNWYDSFGEFLLSSIPQMVIYCLPAALLLAFARLSGKPSAALTLLPVGALCIFSLTSNLSYAFEILFYSDGYDDASAFASLLMVLACIGTLVFYPMALCEKFSSGRTSLWVNLIPFAIYSLAVMIDAPTYSCDNVPFTLISDASVALFLGSCALFSHMNYGILAGEKSTAHGVRPF